MLFVVRGCTAVGVDLIVCLWSPSKAADIGMHSSISQSLNVATTVTHLPKRWKEDPKRY